MDFCGSMNKFNEELERAGFNRPKNQAIRDRRNYLGHGS